MPTRSTSVRVGSIPTTPYVQPGTVGYLGSLGSLIACSPPGLGLPGEGVTPPNSSWQSYGLRNDDDSPDFSGYAIYGEIYLTGNGFMSWHDMVILAGTTVGIAPIALHGANPSLTTRNVTSGYLPGTKPPIDTDTGMVFFTGDPFLDIQRCAMSGMPQGIDPSANGSIISRNYITVAQNRSSGDPGFPSHMDGIFCQGGSGGLTIEENYIDCPNTSDVTAAIFMQSIPATDIPNVVIRRNFIQGGGNSLFNENAVGLVVTDNTFGTFGFAHARNDAPGTIGTWTGNVDTNGTPVASP